MIRSSLTTFFVFVLSLSSFGVIAEPTQLMIRAKAVDAKYIGTSVGGARVIIEDVETGELLDKGWINGSTGNTTTLIKEPITRGQSLSDEKTAGYLATLDINAPRLVKVTVHAPYGYRQAMHEASVTTWVIPGKDILGDGITLSMPGFIVDAWTQVLAGGKIDFYAKTSLLCGCPITKDGYWQPTNYEAVAIIMQDEQKIEEVPLTFTGQPAGMFTGKATISSSGHYKAIVYLIDTTTGNVGVDRTMFEVNLD